MTWRDWYTHDVVNATVGGNTTLAAPLGHIPVHIRDGAALLLHSAPAYTIAETRQSPYELLISLPADGVAFGTAYFDDGESLPPTPHRDVRFDVSKGRIVFSSSGAFAVGPKLESVTVLGTQKPKSVAVGGKAVRSWEYFSAQQKLVVSGLNIDLNAPETVLTWH